MAEWSIAAVLKTVVPISRDRGFESLSLRQIKKTDERRFLIFGEKQETCFRVFRKKLKNGHEVAGFFDLKPPP